MRRARLAGVLERLQAVELDGNVGKELVIINDSSRDFSEKIIQQFEESNGTISAKYIKHEMNRGKGAAIHSGIKMTTGDYIIVLDSDQKLCLQPGISILATSEIS